MMTQLKGCLYPFVGKATMTSKPEGCGHMNSQGCACRSRRSEMDNPSLCRGPDKRVPPRGE